MKHANLQVLGNSFQDKSYQIHNLLTKGQLCFLFFIKTLLTLLLGINFTLLEPIHVKTSLGYISGNFNEFKVYYFIPV